MNAEDLMFSTSRQAQKLTILTYYDGRCCITGTYYEDGVIEMAHIFDAGLSKYKWLRSKPLNTLPIVRRRHQLGNDCFDFVGPRRKKRTPRNKMKWALAGLPEEWEFLPRMKAQFSLLLNLVGVHE